MVCPFFDGTATPYGVHKTRLAPLGAPAQAGERAFLYIVRYLQYIAQIVVQKWKIWYNVDNDKFALVF